MRDLLTSSLPSMWQFKSGPLLSETRLIAGEKLPGFVGRIIDTTKHFGLKWVIGFSLNFVLCSSKTPPKIQAVAGIERIHSGGQPLCKFFGEKESIYIRKEFNSHRIFLVHQYGRRDVMWIRSLRQNESSAKMGWIRHESGKSSLL